MPLLKRLAACAAASLLVLTLTILIGPSSAFAACDAKGGPLQAGPEPVQQTRLGLKRAFALATGKGVKVAVVDSGVGEHPVLAEKVDKGPDFVPDGEPGGTEDSRCDLSNHGTLVAGIIAARYAPADSTFYGVAPAARILSVRVWGDAEPSKDTRAVDQITAGVNYAAGQPDVDVINLSVTTQSNDPGLRAAVQHAATAGKVIVVAAGNTSDGRPEYPGAWSKEIPELLAVAGIDPVSGKHADNSSTGDWVGIAAPGVGVFGPAAAGGGYGILDGTSFAAPFVSGAAALLRERFPEMSARDIVKRLKDTANHPAAAAGHDNLVGYGEVDPYAALTADLPALVTSESGAVPPPPVMAEGDDTTPELALASVGIAAVLIALLMAARFSVPRGNRRGWRG